MWKDTFGSAESLEYPQEMRKILLKLRSLTDIRLPGLVEAEGDEVSKLERTRFVEVCSYFQPAHSPIPFVGSQEDTEDRSLLAKGKSPIGQQIHGTLGIFAKSIKQSLLSPSSKPALLLGGTPGSARRTIKTTPKARLRHDDSQIQFAAIESSPAEEEAGESQTLTDRQKEVRERQSQDTAAMFPDIRSSPRAASRDPQPTLPKLVFQPNGTEPPQSTMDDDSSPVFPPDALMNDFLGSSPTPSSSRKTSTGSHAEDGPPSSPPFVSSHLEQFKKIDPAVGKDLYCAVPSTNLGEPVHGLSKFIARRNDEVMSGTGSGTVVEQAQQYSRERVQTLVPVSIPAQSKEHIFSDSDGDVFVDAPAELHVTQPDAKQAAHDESHATSSISDRVFSLDQLEADQIQAQLTSEMERASSQRSQRLPQSTSQSDASSQYTRKRKDIFDVPPTPAKKPRRSMISSSPQRTLEIRRVDEIVADCVLIDVRPTTGHKSFETVQFKREKSPSPSMITATQFGDVGITRTRKSRTSRPSQENSFLRRNTRQNQVQAEQVDELDVSSLPPAKSTRRASRSTILSSGTPNASSNHEKAVPRNTKRAAVKQRKKKTHEIEAANSSTFNLELDQTQLTPEGDKQPEKKRIARRQSKVSHRDIHKSQTSDERASERSQEREVNVQDETETGEDPRGILQGFQDMLEKIKRVAMGPEEERATVGVLFECVKEVHDAGRRYTAM
ncbi:hypothetical protein MMC21_004545 [Puttea exsequens]|nr:hypothetical protein [Puttea exsequens]